MSDVYAKRSKSFKNENFILPPNVSGKLHGYCDFVIENIAWTTSKTYSEVAVDIKFWGSEGILCEGIKLESYKQSKTNQVKVLRYQINTNYRLFQSYLKNSEPILLQIYSSKNRDLIATAEIPVKLHHFENLTSSFTYSAPILSKRNFKLGKLTASLNINFNLNAIETTSLSEKENNNNPSIMSRKSNKKIEIVGRKKKISFRDPKPSTLIKTSKSNIINHNANSQLTKKSTSTSSISGKENNKLNIEEHSECNSTINHSKKSLINYLSGQSMSVNEESETLKSLNNVSPSQSVLDAIECINMHNKTTSRINSNSTVNKINSVQVKINTLDFNSYGLSFSKKLQNSKCVIKCAVTSRMFNNKSDCNIISPVFDAATEIIPIDKIIAHSVTLPSVLGHAYINFGFCIKSIDNEQPPLVLGFTRINLLEIVKGNMKFHKKCPVIAENNIKTATVTLKINLGVNLCFDRNVTPYEGKENVSVCSEESILSVTKIAKMLAQKVYGKSHPSTSNDCENHSERRHYENKNVQNEVRAPQNTREVNNIEENRDTEMVDVGCSNNVNKSSSVYHGLLFIEGLRNVKDNNATDYFITYEGFWNECEESTEISINSLFNYLKQFPVICDESFLKKVQNNHLELKLWEKTNENSEKWIGLTKVPLHQFYIAFKDAAMKEHLSLNKLPIISTDAWCNFVSPLSNELYCQAKILLAIGNENQIDYLKLSRNFHNLPKPSQIQEEHFQQLNFNKPKISNQRDDTNNQIKNKLSAFIESLSQKLPEPSAQVNHSKHSSSSSSLSLQTPNLLQQKVTLRKTSDLLDTLQKALTQPPPDSVNLFSSFQQQNATAETHNNSPLNANLKMLINVEQAINLPKVPAKKCRNKRKNKSQNSSQRADYEPITYATFEAATHHLSENTFPHNLMKSHEGFVYCTKSMQSCNPQWNENFEVNISFDILRNPHKKFVVKVWRKASHDTAKIEPSPFEDCVVGFSAIDLSVLLTGLPILSGFYNIVDFSGRINGQLKISFKPLQDVHSFRSPESPLVALTRPLNIDVNCTDSQEAPVNDGSTLLSRTLKRKFTELDEITQRLKARLFDVTGDENLDPDEEFERDLNTAVDDMEDENLNNEDFAWLNKDESNGNVFINQARDFQSQLNKILESQPSTSKANSNATTIPSHREISGCSSSDEAPPLAIDNLLKKYDLDTLINPNIFKNILDPTLANSDSTPTLNAQPKIADNASEESADTTVSSIISNDQVQTIQNALQKTSLHENNNDECSRKDPDGKNHLSE